MYSNAPLYVSMCVDVGALPDWHTSFPCQPLFTFLRELTLLRGLPPMPSNRLTYASDRVQAVGARGYARSSIVAELACFAPV